MSSRTTAAQRWSTIDPCIAPQPALQYADAVSLRMYLELVYPSLRSASMSDSEVKRLFATRQWFYTTAIKDKAMPPDLSENLISPSRHICNDGFFGAGLVQRDSTSRYAGLLPCTPGTECVQRQSAYMPKCAPGLARRGRDVWLEVVHLSFDGRHRPNFQPRGWTDFLDHGESGWR